MHYYGQLKGLSTDLKIDNIDDPLSILLRMPDILSSSKEELSNTEWEKIVEAVTKTIVKVDEFRSQEGSYLNADFIVRINKIKDLLRIKDIVDKF